MASRPRICLNGTAPSIVFLGILRAKEGLRIIVGHSDDEQVLAVIDSPIGFGDFESLVDKVRDLLSPKTLSLSHGGVLIGLHRVEERRERYLGQSTT